MKSIRLLRGAFLTSLILGVALMVIAASAGGCQLFQGANSTPALLDPARPIADRIASGEKIYTATLKELTLLRKAGAINDDQQRTIAGLRQKASAAFDSAHLFADAGATADANAQLDIVQDVIRQLTLKIYESRKGK